MGTLCAQTGPGGQPEGSCRRRSAKGGRDLLHEQVAGVLLRAMDPRVTSGTMSSSAPASWYRAMMAVTSPGVPAITGDPGRACRFSLSHAVSVDRYSSAWVETWISPGSRPGRLGSRLNLNRPAVDRVPVTPAPRPRCQPVSQLSSEGQAAAVPTNVDDFLDQGAAQPDAVTSCHSPPFKLMLLP